MAPLALPCIIYTSTTISSPTGGIALGNRLSNQNNELIRMEGKMNKAEWGGQGDEVSPEGG